MEITNNKSDGVEIIKKILLDAMKKGFNDRHHLSGCTKI